MKKLLSLALILLLVFASCATADTSKNPATSAKPDGTTTTEAPATTEAPDTTEAPVTTEEPFEMPDETVVKVELPEELIAGNEELPGTEVHDDSDPYIGIKEAELTATNEAITIDAKLDNAYKNKGTLLKLDTYTQLTGDPSSLTEANAWVTYDKEFVYVYVLAKDTDIGFAGMEAYLSDGISIMLDFGYHRDKVTYGGNESDLAYITIAHDDTVLTYHSYANKEIEHAIGFGEGGYAIEAKLPLPADFNGNNIGMEIQVLDTTEAIKVGCATWNVSGEQMYQYRHVCGTVIFTDNLWG